MLYIIRARFLSGPDPYLVPVAEPGVGLGIGVCCLTLENSSPGIYIHSLAPGSVAKMDGRLRYMLFNILNILDEVLKGH